MNLFLKSATDRLMAWKEFKETLNENQSDLEHLEAVVKWWSVCPLVSRSLDPYDCNTWLSGWEMLHYNEFCKSSLALGMGQTLLQRNGRWSADRLEFWLIDDYKDIFLILVIDNKYIVNYNYKQIDLIENLDCRVLDKIIWKNEKYENK